MELVMSQQTSIMDNSTAALVDKLIGDVRRFLAFMDRDEIGCLLSSLQAEVAGVITSLAENAARQGELLGTIGLTTDYAELRRVHDELNSLEMERFLKYQSVPALHRNCTDYRDLLGRRTLALVTGEMERAGKGAPPLPFALISMGSDGREEQTLITDQDYLVVYADGGGESADAYFQQFSELLVERLAEVGFQKCTGGIMPSNQTWRGSLAQWNRRLLAIVRYEYEDYAKDMMNLIVISDARYVAGDEKLANILIERVRNLALDYFQVLWGMAKAATEMKLAIGFLKRLWTEGSGEHKGEFNLKLLAWAPLVMNVRILAINQGIPATNTIKRIELLADEKSLSQTTAAGLIEAYQVLTRQRILLQIKVIKGIHKDSYYLNPYQLPDEERELIRLAILRIEELQKTIHINFSIV
jgi:signal-transduction protein with cAMP-binding, CBS, and nucleotidyltransferase domain